MRTITHIVLYLIPVLSLSGQCVQLIPTDTTLDWHAVYFQQVGEGFISGEQGTIQYTNNTGVDWFIHDARTRRLIHDLFFSDDNTGWAIGDGGIIRHTTNSGQSWQQQYSPLQSGLYAIDFSDDGMIGLIVGECGLLLRSTDGGLSWVQGFSGVSDHLYDIEWLEDGNALISGAGGILLRSVNDGLSWIVVDTGFNGDWNALSSYSNTVWLAGDDGILRSDNGGVNWNATALNNTYQDIAAINNTSAFAVGVGGSVHEIIDGGATHYDWSLPQVTQSLEAVHFPDSTIGYAVGNTGVLIEIRRFYVNAVEVSPASEPGIADGSATITISGGTEPYDLAWTGATPGNDMMAIDGVHMLNGLAAGSYTISATDDSGCLIQDTFSIGLILPDGDDCGEEVVLGTVPVCLVDTFSNINASVTDIGFNNLPSCLSTEPLNDVWFSFQSDDDTLDYTISLNSIVDNPIENPFIVLYTGDCSLGGLAEVECISSSTGNQDVVLHVLGLTPNTNYFLRVGSLASTGTFQLCIEPLDVLACIPERDSLELLAFYNANNGINWSNNWDVTSPMTSWYGVLVNEEGCVITIDLDGNPAGNEQSSGGNNLSGELIDIELNQLEGLFLNENNLSGGLLNFTNLPNLVHLSVGANDLEGQIPDFDQLPSLRTLICGFNDLSGSIPNFTNLPNLKIFNCSGNQLFGSIPDWMNVPLLEEFQCSQNMLTGNSPTFSSNTVLKSINLSSNNLQGSLPSFEHLTDLTRLDISDNELNGVIPDVSADLSDFRQFYFSNNNFTFEDILVGLDNYNALIESNAILSSDTLRYAPQDSVFTDTTIIRLVGESLNIDLGFDAGVSVNAYQWYKNGEEFTLINGDNRLEFPSLVLDDSGEYYVIITNIEAPELILYSRLITLEVSPCLSEAGILSEVLCAEGAIDINGEVFDQSNPSGSVFFPGGASNGCDSTLSVNLSFEPAILASISEVLCPDQSINIGGVIYDQSNPSGIEVLTAINGCDSTVMVSLEYYPAISTIINSTLCDGESITIGNTTYNQSNPSGTEIFSAVNGCDSTVQINLNFYSIIETDISLNLCDGESILVGSVAYDQSNPSGIEVLSAINGCDSTVIVDLSFESAIITNNNATLCDGESLVVGNTTYDQSSPTGTETLTATNGCDSTVIVSLSFEPAIITNLNPFLCNGDGIMAGDGFYDQSNSAGTEVLIASNGCDSTVIVTLSFEPEIIENYNATLCNGDSVIIGNTTYDQLTPAGTEILTAANGCDSTIIVNLFFESFISADYNTILCDGASEMINGTLYDQSNPFGVEVFTTVSGCDSIVNVELDFYAPISSDFITTLCDGESIVIGNSTYNQTNSTGTEILLGTNGCDSIITVDISFYEVIDTSIALTLCNEDTLIVGSNIYNQNNPIGTEVLLAINGCDSIVNIDLSFEPAIVEEVNATLCHEDSLIVGTTIYNSDHPAGTEALLTSDGCDSTINVILDFYPLNEVSPIIQICPGQSYMLGDESLTTAGDYVAILTDENGCDSIVTLTLEQLDTPVIIGEPITDYQICEGDTLNIILNVSNETTIDWYDSLVGDDLILAGNNQLRVTSAGNYYAEARGVNSGCLSLERLAVNVEVFPNVFTFLETTTCSSDEVGIDTLHLNTIQDCDSLVITTTTLSEPTNPTLIDVVTCDPDAVGLDTLFLQNVDGCDSLVIINSTYEAIIPTFDNNTICIFDSVGLFVDTLTTIQGCDSIVITENIFPASLIFNLPDTTLCVDQTYTDTIVLNTAGCDTLLIQHIIPAPALETTIDTVICAGQEVLFAGMLISTPNTYFDTLTSFNGCDSLITLSLFVQEDALEETIDTIMCVGDTIMFGGFPFTEGGPFPQHLLSQSGCDSIAILRVEWIDPEAYFLEDDMLSLINGELKIVTNVLENDVASLSGGYVELLENPQHGSATIVSDGFLEYDLTNPAFLGIDSFKYQFCIESCIDTCWQANIYISVLEDCIAEIEANLPTGFTPDDDGINDTFDPLNEVGVFCVEGAENAELVIISQWNEIVYHAKKYQPWDGKINSRLAPQGTYYYILSFSIEGEEHVLRKPLHLLR